MVEPVATSRVAHRPVPRWRTPVAAALLCLAVGMVPLAQSAGALRAFVGRTLTGTVTSIVDGDTVRLQAAGGTVLTVRLDGIDTPERGEPFSAQATRATRVLLLAKSVTFTGTDVDRYDRLVARIRVDGVDVSTELVRQGLACHFTRYSSDPVLAQAQVEARNRGVGFWAATAQRPSCAVGVRATTPSGAAGGPFHGNRSSRVYHASTCRNYNCRNCTVVFTTSADAQAAGFKPAGDCLR